MFEIDSKSTYQIDGNDLLALIHGGLEIGSLDFYPSWDGNNCHFRGVVFLRKVDNINQDVWGCVNENKR